MVSCKFSNYLFYFCEKLLGILIEIALNMWIALGSMHVNSINSSNSRT